jgi:hypothetical protein
MNQLWGQILCPVCSLLYSKLFSGRFFWHCLKLDSRYGNKFLKSQPEGMWAVLSYWGSSFTRALVEWFLVGVRERIYKRYPCNILKYMHTSSTPIPLYLG